MTRCVSVLMCLASLSVAACGGGAAPPNAGQAKAPESKTPRDQVVLTSDEQATGKIETQKVLATDAPAVLRVSGRIARADDRIWHVGVRTSGLVRVVAVTLGDAVRKGQVLARFRANEVREERARYRTAVAELQQLEGAATLSKRNYERAQSLLELKAASVLQVDQARQDVVVADAAVKNAQTEVERATAVLKDDLEVPIEAKAGNEEADQVPILAPYGGYVLEKNVTPGGTIAPGQDAFVIGDLSEVWMLASVRQENLGQLRVGQSVTVTLPGVAAEQFLGRITNLGQEFNPTTRVMQVRIVLSNPGQRLRPEMLANADIPLGPTIAMLTVPSDAVQQIDGQDIVFVRTAPDRFAVRPIRVGATVNGKVPVLEGLKADEQIVVHGSFTLKSHLLRSTMEGE